MAQKYKVNSFDPPIGPSTVNGMVINRIDDDGSIQGYYIGYKGSTTLFSESASGVVTLPPRVTVDGSVTEIVTAYDTPTKQAGVYYNASGATSSGYYITLNGKTAFTQVASGSTTPTFMSDTGYVLLAHYDGVNQTTSLANPTGQVTPVNLPYGLLSGASSVGDDGTLTGDAWQEGGANHVGFYQTTDHVFHTVAIAGADATDIISANSHTALGSFTKDLVNHGFLVDKRSGEIDQIDVKGSVFTQFAGINAGGEIAGRYYTADPTGRWTQHNFLADTNHVSGPGISIGELDVKVLVAGHDNGHGFDS